MGKLKAAYFMDTPAGLGGAGNLLLQQAALMAGLYDAIVVLPEDQEGNYNLEYARRCEKHNLSYVHIRYSTAVLFSLIDFMDAMKSAVEIENFAKAEKIELFHSVQLNIAVECAARKLGLPHLMDIYQLPEQEFRACPGQIYPQYHLCDSLLYSRLWSRNLGISSRCVRPVALLDSIKTKKSYPKEKLKILMLGELCERKNQMAAIRAAELCRGMVEMYLAGRMDNDYAEKCRIYVRKRNLGDFITFCGFISDITYFLETCDCLLCTSTDESFPSSIVEAVTYDLTIISTPVAGVPELFTDGENAFISKDFTHISICESILKCLDSYKNGKINRIHRNACRTWKENFDRGLVRKQIDEFYKEIVSSGRRGNQVYFSMLEAEVQKTVMLLRDIADGGEKWIQGRYLYYTLARKRLCEGTLYIWGAGRFGRLAIEIFERICPGLEIKAFVDSNKKGFYMGKPIIGKEDIIADGKNFCSISFWGGREGAELFLENKGMKLHEQVWIIP